MMVSAPTIAVLRTSQPLSVSANVSNVPARPSNAEDGGLGASDNKKGSDGGEEEALTDGAIEGGTGTCSDGVSLPKFVGGSVMAGVGKISPP